MKINEINIKLLELKSFNKSKIINNDSDDKSDKFFIDLLKKTSDWIKQIVNEENSINFINTQKHSRIFNSKKDSHIIKIIKMYSNDLSSLYDKSKFNRKLEQYLENSYNPNNEIKIPNKFENEIFFKMNIGKKPIRLIGLIMSDKENSGILFPLFWDINHNIDSVKGRENNKVKYKWELDEVAVHNFFKCSLFNLKIKIICPKSLESKNDFNNINCEETYLKKIIKKKK